MAEHLPADRNWREAATDNDDSIVKEVENINAYLVPGPNVIVGPAQRPLGGLPDMTFGSMPNDGGYLLLDASEAATAVRDHAVPASFIRPFVGSQEFSRGIDRRCIWVSQKEASIAATNPWLNARFDRVRAQRVASDRPTTKALADIPYRFGEVRQTGEETVLAVAAISSENREYLPCGLLPPGAIISNKCYVFFDVPLWNISLIASRLHPVWIGTVCARMRTDFSYSNTLGWNTFPVPTLTEKNKADLTRCAEDILLARGAHFPATIANLYDPENMPADLRAAHERNDKVLKRIYIGRRFRERTGR
ncbi:type IIL restriction-modification enzyme MmeI [Bradyrhizobium japonicum]|uniref:type IIL restriction-modification enzyme MmeI n=1 Tax=Bradyrhizobium japonicum TaxID=375 RepID=UPI0033970C81